MIDFYEQYFELHTNTEAPAIIHRWAITAAVGAWLGRQTWLPFGAGRVFPNQYVMIVGNPGVRKSTAIKFAAKMLRQAGYEYFAPKKTSKEKFLLDLMEGQQADEVTNGDADKLADFNILSTDDRIAKEIFICSDEFNVFAGHGNVEFFEILGDMWDHDSELDYWRYRLKNSKSIRIWQPTVSILGGNTPTGFADCFPLIMLGQGFMSRMLLIYADPSGKKIPNPPIPPEEKILAFVETLLEMKRNVIGPMQLHSEAKEVLAAIYHGWEDLDDTRFQHYSSRRHQHLLKLCMIQAAMRKATAITRSDVIRANTILAFAETQMPKALGELGKSKTSEAANKVMQLLYGAKKPLTVKEIWPAVRTDLEKPADLGQVLANLEQAGKIQSLQLQGTHRGFLARQTSISAKRNIFIDENVLRGKEIP